MISMLKCTCFLTLPIQSFLAKEEFALKVWGYEHASEGCLGIRSQLWATLCLFRLSGS